MRYDHRQGFKELLTCLNKGGREGVWSEIGYEILGYV